MTNKYFKKNLLILGGLLVGLSSLSVHADTSTTNSTPPPQDQKYGNLRINRMMGGVEQPALKKSLDQLKGNEFDKNFLEQQIQLRQTLMTNSEIALKNTHHELIKKLANETIQSEKIQIDLLQKYQKDLGYKK